MRACGATPPNRPASRPSTRTLTPALPAATEETWVPWPSTSWADSDSDDRMRSAPKPSTNQRAPTILRVQSSAVQPSPSAHAPANSCGSGPRPGTSAKAGDSVAMPESTTPITTPAPPRSRGLVTVPRTVAADVRPASGPDRVGLDRGDAGLRLEGAELVGGEAGREAVERGGPAVGGLAGADRREQGVLPREQVGGVAGAGGGARALQRDERQRLGAGGATSARPRPAPRSPPRR